MTWKELKRYIEANGIRDNTIILGFRDRSKPLKECIVKEPWIVGQTSKNNTSFVEIPIKGTV